MTKKVKISVFALLFAFSALILTLSLVTKEPSEKGKVQNTTSATVYTVADYQGKIAVFKNREKTPFEIYDSYVYSLPKEDRERLKSGIQTESESELQKIIEDYTS
ncbi:MAG: hypothetical protein ACI4N4_06565 [Candidatus Fimenecus sp.]